MLLGNEIGGEFVMKHIVWFSHEEDLFLELFERLSDAEKAEVVEMMKQKTEA